MRGPDERSSHSSQDSNPNSAFDWDGFQNQFFVEGKWKEALQTPGGSLPWIEEYIKQLVSDAVPRSIVKTSDKSSHSPFVTCQVFDTHDMLIGKIKVSREQQTDSIRIFLSSSHLLIKGLPKGEEKSIMLPANVLVSQSIAICKDHVIEVRMPKESGMAYKEIPIQHL